MQILVTLDDDRAPGWSEREVAEIIADVLNERVPHLNPIVGVGA